jgi:hypothetical protein
LLKTRKENLSLIIITPLTIPIEAKTFLAPRRFQNLFIARTMQEACKSYKIHP